MGSQAHQRAQVVGTANAIVTAPIASY